METDLEASTFQNKPAYRYIRESDKLPTIEVGLFEEPAMARIKIFDPTGLWTWYINSYDPDTRIAFGFVDGFELEYGEFSMEELCEARGKLGLPLERDLYWTPCPMKDIERK